jgi:hypothetical protein
VDQRYPKPPTVRRALDDLSGLDPDRLQESFDRAFSIVAFAMNRHLVDHMLRTARRFGIDFETLVVWAVLAHQNCAHLMPPGSLPSQLLDDSGRLPDRSPATLRPLRLRDLTQITQIPRETVRRKLNILRELGWIVETDDGWLVNRDKHDPELREFTFETARRFLAAANDVTRALRDAEQRLG